MDDDNALLSDLLPEGEGKVMSDDLATRLEAAERGSPDLSAEVLTVVTGKPHTVRYDDYSRKVWIDWSDPEVIARGTLDVPRGGSCLLGCGLPFDVTESIDAVWALAKATLRESWFVVVCGQIDGAVTVTVSLDSLHARDHSGTAGTPALALCAALVRACEG